MFYFADETGRVIHINSNKTEPTVYLMISDSLRSLSPATARAIAAALIKAADEAEAGE